MPKKKGQKKSLPRDFTINDCANAPKPVGRIKKVTVDTADLAWDEIPEDDFDIVENINEDGSNSLIYQKKVKNVKHEQNIDDRPGILYPEIVWYYISKYVMPEDVGNFAGINRAAYAVTKRESFWCSLYNKYCKNNVNLPEKLCFGNSYKVYGLRQRVIRALYFSYNIFVKKVQNQAMHDSKPHQLVKRLVVSTWFQKGSSNWIIYFKLKKSPMRRINKEILHYIDELGRVDANPEEDCQVLQVTCQSLYELPPLMGMTLSSVSILLSQGFRYHKLHLGFNTGQHNVSKNILPECTMVIDKVVNISVYDWWHPKYPHSDEMPSFKNDEESLPLLKNDFFSNRDLEF